ncbi:hypothetical protein FOL47_007841 [Perkinsus chesapeaki]|uniref:Uncharacterized protein n=1 Tax=Perkinsus chesapeaki TaxID=330153 RepID=A0A7J6MV04_PERCH|nr:hypothetical protein FOL47_007841 [Perkinsus chesapeaki]
MPFSKSYRDTVYIPDGISVRSVKIPSNKGKDNTAITNSKRKSPLPKHSPSVKSYHRCSHVERMYHESPSIIIGGGEGVKLSDTLPKEYTTPGLRDSSKITKPRYSKEDGSLQHIVASKGKIGGEGSSLVDERSAKDAINEPNKGYLYAKNNNIIGTLGEVAFGRSASQSMGS